MKRESLVDDSDKIQFVTFSVVDHIDVFTKKCYCECILEGLNHFIAKKEMTLYSFVIMSSHIEFIFSCNGISGVDLIHHFKKITSKKILSQIQSEGESRREWMLERFKMAKSSHGRRKYRFWQVSSAAEIIQNGQNLRAKIEFIHSNPVRQKIVKTASNYIYSSASQYADSLAEDSAIDAITL